MANLTQTLLSQAAEYRRSTLESLLHVCYYTVLTMETNTVELRKLKCFAKSIACTLLIILFIYLFIYAAHCLCLAITCRHLVIIPNNQSRLQF